METFCVRIQWSSRCLVPWTIFQVSTDISLNDLFYEKIKTGAIDVIRPTEDLTRAEILETWLGKSREDMARVDRYILLSDLSGVFGQFIKYIVTIEQPAWMDQEVFESIRHLPDPMVDVTKPDHYLPFDKVFSTETTEKDLPSLEKHKKRVISYSPSIQHVKNVDVMIQCDECKMWRLLFSKKKLTIAQRHNLEEILEDVSYSCGALLDELALPPALESVCVKDHKCDDPLERLYYSAGYPAICYYCASEDLDESVPDDVYPLCSACKHREHVKKRTLRSNN